MSVFIFDQVFHLLLFISNRTLLYDDVYDGKSVCNTVTIIISKPSELMFKSLNVQVLVSFGGPLDENQTGTDLLCIYIILRLLGVTQAYHNYGYSFSICFSNRSISRQLISF